MQVHVFDLHIPAYEVLRFYEGRVHTVRARDHADRWVQFAFEHIITFATRAGISGKFAMTVDDTGKFRGIERLG